MQGKKIGDRASEKDARQGSRMQSKKEGDKARENE